MRKRTRIPIEVRFWKYVNKTNDCWLWTGAVNHWGYGMINSGGKNGKAYRAHRISWEIHNGPIPTGINVLHHCDNPPCVNPAHLFLGTIADNNEDMTSKGRRRGGSPAGDNHPRRQITDAQIAQIRAEYIPGVTPMKLFADRYGVTITTIWRKIRNK